MNHSEKIYKMETYALVQNVDESILLLNPFLKEHGHYFIELSITDLESDFSGLLSLPESIRSNSNIQIGEELISQEFYNLLKRSPIFENVFYREQKIFMLKSEKIYERKVINGTYTTTGSMAVLGETIDFCNSFVQQAKLYKSGDIRVPLLFQIDIDSRFVHTEKRSPIGEYQGSEIFKLTSSDPKNFMSRFRIPFEANELSELSLSYFNLSYYSPNPRTKFITLFTSLECLFNNDRNPIAHIVARHLSLILSRNETQFDENYRMIKKLYAIRSTIVHGNTPSKKDGIPVEELASLVRAALNYSLNISMTKSEFFSLLNRAGMRELKSS